MAAGGRAFALLRRATPRGRRRRSAPRTAPCPSSSPGASLAFVTLPEGMDPDDLVRAKGAAAFEALLRQPQQLADRIWAHEAAAEPLDTPEARAGLRRRLSELAQTIAEPACARNISQSSAAASTRCSPPRPASSARAATGRRASGSRPSRGGHGRQGRPGGRARSDARARGARRADPPPGRDRAAHGGAGIAQDRQRRARPAVRSGDRRRARGPAA
ncbi:MAG: hypothetical protein WDN24_03325 [Sphingomonas sp.]